MNQLFFYNSISKKKKKVIIVGGGTAGCVLAARLSENPKVSVLLLEVGGSDDRLVIYLFIYYLIN